MSAFKFLHAADLHLDSPLEGLRQRSVEMSARLKDASKQALDNLIERAIDEKCRFVVLAGDIFDGQVRNFPTGLHFVRRLSKLRAAGIDVFIVFGNHDAENKFASQLPFAEGVHLFSHRKAETVMLDDVGAAIHGRSFPKRDVTENIAAEYPPPRPGFFNVGLLHTACAGKEEYHAPYAPCSLEQLVNHGYQYWALGHVHRRQVLHADPWVVYPGNLQGRNAKETGAKGATLVEVVDGRVVRADHCTLDAVRWEIIEVDVSGVTSLAEVTQLVRAATESTPLPQDRLTAVRVRLVGTTTRHGDLIAQRGVVNDEIETLLAAQGGDLWLEKVELKTAAVKQSVLIDASIAGKVAVAVAQIQASPWYEEQLARRLAEIRGKMPASAHPEALMDVLKAETPDRAVALALSLIEPNTEASDEAA